MQCQVIKPFNRRGEIQQFGSFVEIPEEMFLQMAEYVQAVAPADTYRTEKKAWLVNGELRTSGLIADLSGEVVKLTADDMPLQKKLLLLHCQKYDQHHFPALAELWQERAAIMQFHGGLSKEDAELSAAEILNCMAFLSDLRLNT